MSLYVSRLQNSVSFNTKFSPSADFSKNEETAARNKPRGIKSAHVHEFISTYELIAKKEKICSARRRRFALMRARSFG